MLEEGTIELHGWKKSIGESPKREVAGYRRPVQEEQPTMTEEHRVNPDLPDDIPALPDDLGSNEGTLADQWGELSPRKGTLPLSPLILNPRVQRPPRKRKKSKRNNVTA